MAWIAPWYHTIEVEDFRYMVPQDASFKIFIKRQGGDTAWEEVFLLKPDYDASAVYEYHIETRPDGAGIYHPGNLYVFYYGTDAGDTPSLKVVY